MTIQDLFGLTGKRAFISGSSKGIGFALAKGLAGAGASIVINGRNEEMLAASALQLEGHGAQVSTACFDVTDPTAVNAGIEKIEAETGPIDILINNAGMQHRTPLEDFPDDAWDTLMRTNVIYKLLRI